MKKVIVLSTIALLAASSVEARAAGERLRPQITSGQGPINRLIELERRKNAAIRRMLFGR